SDDRRYRRIVHRLIPPQPLSIACLHITYASAKSLPRCLLPEYTCGDQASGSRQYSRSVAAHRGGDVGLVACCVGQRPPCRRVLVAHHPAAGGECRCDARLRLLVRHPYRDVDRATAVRARLIHSLEPEPWRSTTRIDEVLVGAVAPGLIPEDGSPERH